MHAIVPHEDAARVRLASEAVSVRLASLPQRSLPAHVVRAAAGASHLLPSAALSERFGGPLKTIADDRDGLRTETAFFDVEVALDAPVPTWIGERARVRFAHPAEPLAAQWLRSGRQLLLQFGREHEMTLLQLPLVNRTHAPAPGIRYGRYPQLHGHEALPDAIEAARRQLKRLLAAGAAAHLAVAKRIQARIDDGGNIATSAGVGPRAASSRP